MGLLKQLEELQSPKDQAIFSLKSRRGKTDPWLRNMQLMLVANCLLKGNLTPEDIGATEEEKKELEDVLAKWASEKSPKT